MSRATDTFQVPAWLNAAGAWVERHPRFWARMGDLESRVLADEIAELRIERPIYVSGLARAGTTILLELLAEHPDTASHAYKDFPFVPVPYFWNWFLDHSRRAPGPPVERAHGDGILVTPDSPEALEEMLWMAFFPGLHEPGGPVIDGSTSAPRFEVFYRDHVRKLVWLRGGRRYLAKGNYNVTRLAYLHRIFPDARFVVPVREPRRHVASLVRQHERFCERHRQDARALRYMQRAGHYEFGLDRRPSAIAEARAIRGAWDRGAEIEGWALQWSAVYAHVADALRASPSLREATMVVAHEDLCRAPKDTLDAVFVHCGLEIDDRALASAAERIGARDAGRSPFGPAEESIIERITGEVAAQFGYGGALRAAEVS